jgi:hypothetical protein
MLRVGMQYEIVPTTENDRPPWRVSTRGYAYEMQTASGELVWACHRYGESVDTLVVMPVRFASVRLAVSTLVVVKVQHKRARQRACPAGTGFP